MIQPENTGDESVDDPTDQDLLDRPTVIPTKNFDTESSVSNDGSLPQPGTEIGQYTLIGEIARGAMGVVYRAKHRKLDRVAAIKMVLDGHVGREDLRVRFANEAKAAASLDHPGIVPVFEVGSWNNYPYFVMAFVDGTSLSERLVGGPLPARQAAQVARDVAEAISHAHAHKIIHRDLKPANILMDTDDTPRVTDFGVSKFMESSSDLTSSGDLIGTPHYMPPEQAGGSKLQVGPPADVYSIGAVLYATLTGRPPFQAATPIEVVSQVLTQEPVPPSALNASVPVELEVITLKCLNKSATDRYLTAEELSDDLTRFLAGEPILARPPTLLKRVRLWLRRHVMLASVSGSIAMLLLLTTGIVFALLLQARSQVEQLNVDLQETNQLLMSERSILSRFMRNDDQEKSVFAQYQVERLADAASSRAESQPNLSLKLAIEANDLATKNALAPPESVIELIRNSIARKKSKVAPDNLNSGPQEGEQESLSDELSSLTWPEIVDKARQRILRPLTDNERILYGLEPIQEVNSLNATPEAKNDSDVSTSQ